MAKSFLKWAGGKSKLASFIESKMSETRGKRLVEPFAGSAAISLALEFDAYLLNDINTDLINLYRTLASEKQDFIQYAKSFFIPENHLEDAFYQLRDRFNGSQDITERSAIFIYLNRHAFNGLCRYNKKGLFNVPFGHYKKPPLFPEKGMQDFLSKSDRMVFQNLDFKEIIINTNSNDIIYCDPPYVPLNETASFTAYSQGSFNLDDQTQLADLVRTQAPQTSGILISNHDTPFTRKIYQTAQIEELDVQRNIAAKGSSRKKVKELLAIYE